MKARWLLMFVGLALLTLAAPAGVAVGRQAAKAKKEGKVPTVTATELERAYVARSTKGTEAWKKYEKKTFVVTGEVLDTNTFLDPDIYLSSGNGQINCTLKRSETEKVQKLKKGAKVKVKGRVEEGGTYPRVLDAELVD